MDCTVYEANVYRKRYLLGFHQRILISKSLSVRATLLLFCVCTWAVLNVENV